MEKSYRFIDVCLFRFGWIYWIWYRVGCLFVKSIAISPHTSDTSLKVFFLGIPKSVLDFAC